jgi:putative DNA primase/helicase
MILEEAIGQACASVGVASPRSRTLRRWLRTDAIGKNGKGDGSVMLDDRRVTAWNWQTGEKATVWLDTERPVRDRQRYARQREDERRLEQARAARAAQIAFQLVAAAMAAPHPYLAGKGFPDERPLTVNAEHVRDIGGGYLVPAGAARAILVPARIGTRITSVQLIWPDGTKKFLYGGDIGGASHRIATGNGGTWLCEGYATGLSLRLALKGLSRRDTVLVCFSAANITRVAETVVGRCFVAADHDAPPKAKPDQFGGLGAGEFFARKAGRPYLMPPDAGLDVNDLHRRDGIFAVQRLIANLIREAKM